MSDIPAEIVSTAMMLVIIVTFLVTVLTVFVSHDAKGVRNGFSVNHGILQFYDSLFVSQTVILRNGPVLSLCQCAKH